MRQLTLSLLALFVIACTCAAKKPPVEPTSAPAADPAAESAAVQGEPAEGSSPGMGEKCGPGKSCAPGLTCIEYYGIAGPRGPKFTSCEIPCASAACPKGMKCVTISDGPGQVCRGS